MKTLLLFILPFALVYGCGKDSKTENKTNYPVPPEERISSDYRGLARCTGSPYVKVRSSPGLNQSLHSQKPQCNYGEHIQIEGTEMDPSTGHLYAMVSFGNEPGFIHWAYIEPLAFNLGGAKEPCLTRDRRFTFFDYKAPTQSLLSTISYAEGTGECYHYMFGYAVIESLEEHPDICQP